MGTDRWYGLVINGNKQFNQLSVTLYSLDPNNNTVGLPQSSSNDLVKVFEQTRNQVYNILWDIPESRYSLKGGLLKITNVRLFNIPVEVEQHSNVLNQYVVHDNQLATIIDNAIPSLGFQKFRSHQ
jgi:hypothetical protein